MLNTAKLPRKLGSFCQKSYLEGALLPPYFIFSLVNSIIMLEQIMAIGIHKKKIVQKSFPDENFMKYIYIE